MDVKSSFLNGDVEEEVYIEQPKGFQLSYYVCKLRLNVFVKLDLTPLRELNLLGYLPQDLRQMKRQTIKLS